MKKINIVMLSLAFYCRVVTSGFNGASGSGGCWEPTNQWKAGTNQYNAGNPNSWSSRLLFQPMSRPTYASIKSLAQAMTEFDTKMSEYTNSQIIQFLTTIIKQDFFKQHTLSENSLNPLREILPTLPQNISKQRNLRQLTIQVLDYINSNKNSEERRNALEMLCIILKMRIIQEQANLDPLKADRTTRADITSLERENSALKREILKDRTLEQRRSVWVDKLINKGRAASVFRAFEINRQLAQRERADISSVNSMASLLVRNITQAALQNKRIKDLQEQSASDQSELGQLTKNITKLQRQIAENQSSLDGVTQALTAEQQEKECLAEQMELANKTIVRLTWLKAIQAAHKNQEISRLQEQSVELSRLTKDIAKLQRQIAENQSSLDGVTQALTAEQQEKECLAEQMELANQALTAEQQEKERLAEQIKLENNTMARLFVRNITQAALQNKRIKDLQEQSASDQSELSRLTKDIAKLQRQIAENQSSLDGVTQALTAEQQEKAQSAELSESLKNQVQQLREMLTQLQSEYTSTASTASASLPLYNYSPETRTADETAVNQSGTADLSSENNAPSNEDTNQSTPSTPKGKGKGQSPNNGNGEGQQVVNQSGTANNAPSNEDTNQSTPSIPKGNGKGPQGKGPQPPTPPSFKPKGGGKGPQPPTPPSFKPKGGGKGNANDGQDQKTQEAPKATNDFIERVNNQLTDDNKSAVDNVIQKTFKPILDAMLSEEDKAIHDPLHQMIDAIIKQQIPERIKSMTNSRDVIEYMINQFDNIKEAIDDEKMNALQNQAIRNKFNDFKKKIIKQIENLQLMKNQSNFQAEIDDNDIQQSIRDKKPQHEIDEKVQKYDEQSTERQKISKTLSKMIPNWSDDSKIDLYECIFEIVQILKNQEKPTSNPRSVSKHQRNAMRDSLFNTPNLDDCKKIAFALIKISKFATDHNIVKDKPISSVALKILDALKKQKFYDKSRSAFINGVKGLLEFRAQAEKEKLLKSIPHSNENMTALLERLIDGLQTNQAPENFANLICILFNCGPQEHQKLIGQIHACFQSRSFIIGRLLSKMGFFKELTYTHFIDTLSANLEFTTIQNLLKPKFNADSINIDELTNTLTNKEMWNDGDLAELVLQTTNSQAKRNYSISFKVSNQLTTIEIPVNFMNELKEKEEEAITQFKEFVDVVREIYQLTQKSTETGLIKLMEDIINNHKKEMEEVGLTYNKQLMTWKRADESPIEKFIPSDILNYLNSEIAKQSKDSTESKDDSTESKDDSTESNATYTPRSSSPSTPFTPNPSSIPRVKFAFGV